MWSRRKALVTVGAAVGASAAGVLLWRGLRYPPDTTPEGAYLRIAHLVSRGQHLTVFSYLEDAAQHACFTVRDYRKKSLELVRSAYPEQAREPLSSELQPYATAPDGSDVWLLMAEERGYIARLRKDLSGVSEVSVADERATVVTARGTRYPFRKRQNGMWGITIFTAELVSEAERAARDHAVVEAAAADYAATREPGKR